MQSADAASGRPSIPLQNSTRDTIYLDANFWRGLVLSLEVHVLLVSLALLAPRYVGAWLGGQSVPETPQVSFTFAPPFAEVDESSRTMKPQETPLQGRFDSEARDRVRDERDTPYPLGGEPSSDNTVHRGGASEPEGAPSRGGAEEQAPQKKGMAPSESGLRVADAVGSEVAILTGRREGQHTTRRSKKGGAGAERGPGLQSTRDPASGGALQFGDFSFSTTAWEFEPYWAYMRSRLYANWHPPAAYKDYGLIPGGWTMVRAVLERSGALRHAEIIGRQGHTSLHPSSFAAMLGASPFRALPKDFPEDSLVVVVRFIYQPPGAGNPRDRGGPAEEHMP